MGMHKADLHAAVKEVATKLASLATKQKEYEKRTQHYTEALNAATSAFAKGTQAQSQSPAKKAAAPSLKTHSSEAITQWYREQLRSIITAGKQHDKTVEATSESSATVSPLNP